MHCSAFHYARRNALGVKKSCCHLDQEEFDLLEIHIFMRQIIERNDTVFIREFSLWSFG
jgi:hypothetical protein